MANRVAFWHGERWSALGGGFDGSVRCLAVTPTGVYAGGNFSTAGEVSALNIAKWDGGAWLPLGPGLNGGCRSLAVDEEGLLYAAGAFTAAGDSLVNRVARWDGAHWTPLGTGIQSPYGVNTALAIPGSLVIGGFFNTAGGFSAINVARWDGEVWSPLGEGLDGEVLGLAAAGDHVVAVGSFTGSGSAPANGIAVWDGGAWSGALGEGLEQRPVRSVAARGDTVYVGGSFTAIGGVTAQGVARWSGVAWEALGEGVEGEVRALMLSGSDVYLGGAFATAGGRASQNFARWDAWGVVPVSLLSLAALRTDAGVELRWTVAEASADHAGFDVYREGESGDRVRLTEAPLRGASAYSFVDERAPLGRLRYWLAELTRTGGITWYGPVEAEARDILEAALALAPSRPNPFRVSSRISFTLPRPGRAILQVFDASGRAVRTLVDGVFAAGPHEAVWDGRNQRGEAVAVGVYFYRLETMGESRTHKLVLAR
jgi:hypothetical protein